MKLVLPLAAIAGALAVPSIASARQVTLETQMKDYGGDGAYLAIYLSDRTGRYQRTLWVAAPKAKYWRHLPDWYRATGGTAKVDGISGASVGAGKALRVTVELADTLLDAGYEIHIDTAVEKGLNWPMGPFRLGDSSGLDVTLGARTHMYETTGNEMWKPSPSLVAKVRAGRLGRKTGRGFREYARR